MASNENVADQRTVGMTFDPDARVEEDRKVKELKKANLSAVFGGGMGRLSLVFIIIIFLTIMVFGASKIFGKKNMGNAQAPATNAIINAPGAAAGDSFVANDTEGQMRRERNQQQAAEAKVAGAAYIAPPVLKQESHPEEKPAQEAAGPKVSPEDQRRQLQDQPRYSAPTQDPALLAAQQRRDQELAELKALREKLKKDDIMPQIMVASGLGAKPFSSASYALPDRTKAAQSAASVPSAGRAAPAVKTQLYSAGEACYATLDYGINTDNPGNAVIASSPLCKGHKNVKFIGKYDFKDQAQAVGITFDKIAIPGKPSIAIQAIAIDDKTFGTGIADDVDNHYVRRFGLTAVASFMAGIGKAAQIAVGTTTTNSAGLNSQMQTIQEPMTTERQMKIAAGEIGQQVGEQLKRQNESIKPTVKVYGPKEGDRGIGIVFLADVYEEKK